jgi:mRNA-degrading endonuclease toxin of MazEF toxin-antitoxin module
VLRGEIYVVDPGPGQGREVSGVSPVVVISNDANSVAPFFVAVLPTVDTADIRAGLGLLVTSGESGYQTDLFVLLKQPRAVDASRFTSGPVGIVPTALMKIDFELQVFLDLQNVPLPPRP